MEVHDCNVFLVQTECVSLKKWGGEEGGVSIAGRKYAQEMEKILIHKLRGTIQSHKLFYSPKLFASFDATVDFRRQNETKTPS